jgi:succinoglycan biosynthesis protein ExoA
MNIARSDSLPMVSILMPVRNEEGYIGRSLDAVFAQDYPQELMEVIVADGRSIDRTRDVVESFRIVHPNLRLIDNPGKTAPYGLNAATEQAEGEMLLRVDGHCEIAPDYVRNCVQHLLSDGIAGVGGFVETVGETETARSIALAMSSRFGVGDSAFRTIRDRDLLVDNLNFPAYTRVTVVAAGPYDVEQVRDQDDEYNYRIREAGGTLLLAADVKSRYYSRSSLKRLLSQFYQYGFWKVRVMQKHPRQMSVRQFAPSSLVGVLLLLVLLGPFLRSARRLLLALVATYVVANVGVSIAIAEREGRSHLRILPAAFAALHFGYGAGFLVGLARFSWYWLKPDLDRGK